MAGAQRKAQSISPVHDMRRWLRTGDVPTRDQIMGAGSPNLFAWNEHRYAAITAYGFSIPCAEAVEALLKLGPLLEIAAGTGYWSAILKAAGADIIATDEAVGSPASMTYGFTVGSCFDVQEMDGVEAVRAHPERSVFVSWPPMNGQWITAAAQAVRGRKAFAMIGEWGGCTGHSSLERALKEDPWVEEARVAIPQWLEMSDRLTIHRRVFRDPHLPAARLP